MNRQQSRRFHVARAGACALALILALAAGVGAHPSEVRSITTSLEFSVGVAGSVGLPGSAVAAENAVEPSAGPPGDAEADIYFTAFPPYPPASTNGKLYDDGGPVLGAPPLPPADLTLRTDGVAPPDTLDVDAAAIISTIGPVLGPAPSIFPAGTFLQFSIDGLAGGGFPGPGPPDVATEVGIGFPEATGDVFEAVGPGGVGVANAPLPGPPAMGFNSLLSDEGAHGLAVGDDLDALLVDDVSVPLPAVIDTDGAGPPDMPLYFFSLDAASGLPATVASGADICIPATGGAALGPAVVIPAASLGLVAGDDVDALWIDPSALQVLFSLDRGSPSLGAIVNPFVAPFPGVGCDPCDVIQVTLGGPAGGPPLPPAGPPAVVAVGFQLGLFGDGVPGAPDFASTNLDALSVTPFPHVVGPPLVPAELSVFRAD